MGKKEFCEILAEYVARGGLAAPNPVEDVHDRVTPIGHSIPICRTGESHTFGGGVAANAEATYQGMSEGEVYVDPARLDEPGPWDLEPIWEITGANMFNLKSSS